MTPFQLELSAKAPWTSTTVSGVVVVGWDMVIPPELAECEHDGFDASVEEADLEAPVADRLGLADQLVHPLVVRGAVAALVDVDAERPAVGGPITRCRSRAWNWYAMEPPGSLSSAGTEPIRQSPDSDQWLRRNTAGAE